MDNTRGYARVSHSRQWYNYNVARLAVSVRVLGKKQTQSVSGPYIDHVTTHSQVALQDNAVQATVYPDRVVTYTIQLGVLYDGRFAFDLLRDCRRPYYLSRLLTYDWLSSCERSTSSLSRRQILYFFLLKHMGHDGAFYLHPQNETNERKNENTV